MRRQWIALSLALGIVYLGLTACSALTRTAKVLEPALVIACQAECIELGRPDLAPLCAEAAKIADVLQQLAVVRREKLAQCHAPDAGE